MPTMQAQWMTLTFVAVVTAAVVWVDVWIAINWGTEATISYVLRRIFERCPILYPVFWLAVGILIGHIGLPAE